MKREKNNKKKTAYEMRVGLVGSEMCIRDRKNKASMGCVRETPQIKMKAARDVYEKLPP